MAQKSEDKRYSLEDGGEVRIRLDKQTNKFFITIRTCVDRDANIYEERAISSPKVLRYQVKSSSSIGTTYEYDYDIERYGTKSYLNSSVSVRLLGIEENYDDYTIEDLKIIEENINRAYAVSYNAIFIVNVLDEVPGWDFIENGEIFVANLKEPNDYSELPIELFALNGKYSVIIEKIDGEYRGIKREGSQKTLLPPIFDHEIEFVAADYDKLFLHTPKTSNFYDCKYFTYNGLVRSLELKKAQGKTPNKVKR